MFKQKFHWLLIILFGAAFSPVAIAHDANIFTSYIYKKDGRVLIKVSMAHHGIHLAASKALGGEDKLGHIGDSNYQRKISSYLKERIEVFDGEKKASLVDGPIQLDTHQSDAYFELTGIDPNANTLKVVLSLGKENPYHTNLLRVIDPVSRKVAQKHFLRQSNQWTQMIQFVANTK